MGKISRFGLMELSRQRLRPSLGEGSNITCPRCNGTGHIRGTESTALHILRIIQEEAMKENSAAVHAQVPVDVATFLLNEKRADIHSIEARLKVNVVLIPNTHLETPNYKVERLRHDDLNQAEALPASYNLVTAPVEEEAQQAASQEARPPRQQAAVQGVTPERPAPVPTARQVRQEPAPAAAAPQQGIIGRIFSWFKQEPAAPAPAQPAPRPATPPRDVRPDRFERSNRDRFRGRGESRTDQRPGGRGERPQRQDRQQRPERPQGEQRPQRGERFERHERGAPTDRADSRPQEPVRTPAPQPGTQEQRDGDHERRRRRRGGRDRGERGDHGENRGTSPSTRQGAEQRPPSAAPRTEAPTVPPVPEFLVSPPPAPEIREPAREPVFREEPTTPQYQPAPKIPQVQATFLTPRTPDPAEIQRALQESGLELVQTRPGNTVEPPSEPEFVPAKRERRPPPADLAQPLEQVETGRKEDSSTPN
jgi:ribonuclease E